MNIGKDRHDYRLIVMLANRGSERVEKYQLDLEFPTALLESPEQLARRVPDRCTDSHTLVQITERQLAGQAILPGNQLQVLALDYYMDQALFERTEILSQHVRATLYVPDSDPQSVEKVVSQLEIF